MAKKTLYSRLRHYYANEKKRIRKESRKAKNEKRREERSLARMLMNISKDEELTVEAAAAEDVMDEEDEETEDPKFKINDHVTLLYYHGMRQKESLYIVKDVKKNEDGKWVYAIKGTCATYLATNILQKHLEAAEGFIVERSERTRRKSIRLDDDEGLLMVPKRSRVAKRKTKKVVKKRTKPQNDKVSRKKAIVSKPKVKVEVVKKYVPLAR